MRNGEDGSSRPERVGQLIRAEIAVMLTEGIKDPRIGMVTVTHVGMSKDLRQAVVYVSIYGDESAKNESLLGLNAAGGYIRRELGQRIRLRHVPQLTFKLDTSIDNGHRIDQILTNIANGADENSFDKVSDVEWAPVNSHRDVKPLEEAPTPQPMKKKTARKITKRWKKRGR